MKKNLIKVVLVIVLILLLLFLINLFMNYSILNKICKSNEELNRTITNYYYKHNTEYLKGNMKNLNTETICYNGIYLSKTYIDDALYMVTWFDSNTNEIIRKDGAGNETTVDNTDFVKQYEEMLLNSKYIGNILGQNLFTRINNKDGYYEIKIDDFTVFVDVDTKLIKKYNAGDTISTFDIKTDTVSSSDVDKNKI